MKNQPSASWRISTGECLTVLAGWCFLNFRLWNFWRHMSGAYVVFSLLLSAGILIWLAKRKNPDVSIGALALCHRGYFPKIWPWPLAWRKFGGIVLVAGTVLVPVDLALGFLRFNFTPTKLFVAPFVLVGIFLTIGLVEELVFRQILLVYLQFPCGTTAAVAVSSLLFGLSHIVRGDFPNWPYVLLASLAGAIYALAFLRLNLASAILLHSIVDTGKYLFFS